jgi:hypothetical protein
VQSAEPRPSTIDAATRREVVDSLAARLIRMYVDADTGRMIADMLRARLTRAPYDARLTRDASATCSPRIFNR